MSKWHWLAAAAKIAPGIFQIRRSTWIAAGIGMLVLVGLLIWAAVALVAWLLGATQSLTGAAPEAARSVIAQVEQFAPGVRDKLDNLLAAPEAEAEAPQRDVSGTDVIAVERYPGLVRTHWSRGEQEFTATYEGVADYRDVLEHYAKGLAAQGYVHEIIAAAPDSERHAFRKDNDHVALALTRLAEGRIEVTLVAARPAAPPSR